MEQREDPPVDYRLGLVMANLKTSGWGKNWDNKAEMVESPPMAAYMILDRASLAPLNWDSHCG